MAQRRNALADCPAQQDIEDSRSVAKHLKLDYEIVNLVNQYRDKVVQLPSGGISQRTDAKPRHHVQPRNEIWTLSRLCFRTRI